MDKDELLEVIEGASNFMRGMQFDPRLPSDIKTALIEKALELEEVVEDNLNA
ncbi:hypothetical protein [Acinetobacter lactucae]|uniref:hypothetical protein n=1 Tax=Acinetobacter lactucae TaxID=1785128 RepID=UPI0003DF84A0|nr:hypothetical protein [Acinetobacter lactucae]ETR94596.1 hypothetical protein M211_2212 [Acinetobacter lactucae]